MTPTLHIIPFSHFSEKGMWILDYKGIRYDARPLRNPASRSHIVRLTGGSRTLPVLEFGDRVVADSTDIALFIEREVPQPPLLPDSEPERSECLAIEDWADGEIGVHTRRWLMGHLLFEDPAAGRSLMAKGGIPRPITFLSQALFTSFLGRAFDTSREKARKSAVEVTGQLRVLEDKLADREYLVGDRFTLADLAVCALMVPIVDIGPWHRDPEFATVMGWMKRLRRQHGRRRTLADPITSSCGAPRRPSPPRADGPGRTGNAPA